MATQQTPAQPSLSSTQEPSDARAAHVKDADVSIACKGNVSVRAHKLLLSMASPVWRSLLDSTPDCSSIPAEDVSADTMEAIMCYIYPIYPKPAIDWENVKPMTSAAHKYDIDCVLKACLAFLNSISFDTHMLQDWEGPWLQSQCSHCLHWLRLADRWGLDSVADRCIEHLMEEVKQVAAPAPDPKKRRLDAFGLPVPMAIGTPDVCQAAVTKVVRPRLVKWLRSDAFLSALRPPTLIKLVKAMAGLGQAC